MKNKNYWKYAFIALLAVILVFGGILGSKVFSAPNETYKVSSKIESQNEQIFTVNMNKDQANEMAQYYLEHTLNNGKAEYQLKLKKDAELTGEVKFLGAKIHFNLIMTPYAKTNGDVLLKAKQIKVGALSLTIKFVMNYAKNSFKIPDWVDVNSKDKTILLKFTKYRTKEGYSIRAKKLDLKNDKLVFDVMNTKITDNQ
ncbi:YpmS family protein [Companilactobacillus mishanensis]|uniref:YpmS family protein n=1 Tax=Companilactobacillus mishanensis TaxID=2486008 RepID=UPI00362B3E1D